MKEEGDGGRPGTVTSECDESRREALRADSTASWGKGKAKRECQRYRQPPLFELELAQFIQEAVVIYAGAAGFTWHASQLARLRAGKIWLASPRRGK